MKDLTFAADPLTDLPQSLRTHAVRRLMNDWEKLLASKTRKALPVGLMAVSLAACSDEEKEEAQLALDEFIEDEELSEEEAEELQDAFDEIVEEIEQAEEDENEETGDEGAEQEEEANIDLPTVTDNQVLESSGPVAIELPEEGAVVEEGENYVQVGETVVLDTNAFDYLGVGEIYEQIIPYIGNGGLLSIKLEILGLNDAPVPVDVNGAAIENGAPISVDLIPEDIDPDLIHYPGNLKVTNIVDPTGAATHDGRNLNFNPDVPAFEYLAQGEILNVEIPFTVEDILGASGDGTAWIEVTGVNDDPVFQADGDSKNVVEDAQIGAFDKNGTLLFDDVDLLDTHQEVDGTMIVADGPVRSTAAVISSVVEPSSPGEVNYTISYDSADLQDLAEGVSEVETYTVTVSDNNGGTDTATVSVRLVGTNDDPEFVTDTDTKAITEDADTEFNETGTFEFNDVDVGDTHQEADGTSIASVGTTIGVGTITNVAEPSSPGSVDWNIFYDNADLQFLGAGETRDEEFTVTVSDNNGGTDTGMVTVTLTGVNDDIENAVIPTAGTVNEDTGPFNAPETNVRAVGNVTFDDPDWSDTHEVSADFVSSTGPGGAEIGGMEALLDALPVEGVGGAARWRYTAPKEDVQFLGASETVEQIYTYTIDDKNGSTVTETVTITIEGENDPVVIDDGASKLTGAVDEDAGPFNGPGTKVRDTGTIVFTDVDVSDSGGHTASVVFKESDNPDGGAKIGKMVMVDDDAVDTFDPDPAGSVKWRFTAPKEDVQHLAAGESIEEIYTVTIDDGKGSTESRDVSVIITGQNDAPVVDVPNSDPSSFNRNIVANDNVTGTVTREFTVTFDDVDLSDSGGHTVGIAFQGGGTPLSATSTAVVTTDTDPTTGEDGAVTVTVTYNRADLAFLDDTDPTITETYEVTIDDGNGGTVTQEVNVRLTGFNDAPEAGDDTGATDADTVLNAPPDADNVLDNDEDPDDNDTLTVTEVNGSDTDVGTQITLASGALLTLNSDGSYEYDPDGAFDSLALGASATDTFEYTVSDNDLTDTAMVTITVNGVNEDPVYVNNSETKGVKEDNNTQFNKSGTFEFNDVDVGDTHQEADGTMIESVGTTIGVGSITSVVEPSSPGAVNWNIFYNNADLQFLGDGETVFEEFKVTVSDNNGGTDDTGMVTVKLTGVNDDPLFDPDASLNRMKDADNLHVSGELRFNGNIGFEDVDLIDTHTDAISAGTLVGSDLAAPAVLGAGVMFPAPDFDDTTGDGPGFNGNVRWQVVFDAADVALLETLGAGESHVESYEVSVNDGLATDTATVTLTINGVNDDPVAVDDYYYQNFFGPGSLDLTQADSPAADNLLENDTDVDANDVLTVGGNTDPTNGGTLTIGPSADGGFVYTAADGQFQTDTFTYDVVDGNGGSDTGTAFITDTKHFRPLDGGSSDPRDLPQEFSFYLDPDLSTVQLRIAATAKIDGGAGVGETMTISHAGANGIFGDADDVSITVDGDGDPGDTDASPTGYDRTFNLNVDALGFDETNNVLNVRVEFGAGVVDLAGDELVVELIV